MIRLQRERESPLSGTLFNKQSTRHVKRRLWYATCGLLAQGELHRVKNNGAAPIPHAVATLRARIISARDGAAMSPAEWFRQGTNLPAAGEIFPLELPAGPKEPSRNPPF